MNKYQKADRLLREYCSVDNPSSIYGITIATLDGCIDILREFNEARPYAVSTICEAEAKFFKECGFEVVGPGMKRKRFLDKPGQRSAFLSSCSPIAYTIYA